MTIFKQRQQINHLASCIENCTIEENSFVELTENKFTSLCANAKLLNSIKNSVSKHLPDINNKYDKVDSELVNLVQDSIKLKELLISLTSDVFISLDSLSD